MSYEDLDIYKISFDLFIETHRKSLKLPKHELYELGSQIRRSSDSVNSNIVEGYGRRIYKNDYLKFLRFSHSSCDETLNHIKKLIHVYPDLSSELELEKLAGNYRTLSIKIHNYIEYVKNNWRT
ncbi:four helix bundle protein [Chryseobacterium sp. MDT2-18]|uniref:four helix bundle protein n=1 Tax=Chryseobacterium sp. MDT2-18 TaxID=1259136 RepID=UPI002781A175|nr:four helix bundle protein [Chryseobacterium sp. MDT2-18]MDQ0476825.1 four helix bundle protein [Chryseobacterium sp. MDT2-18]